MKFLWFFTIAGCLLGGITLIEIAATKTAMQQGAGAAIAAALAVIPYCLARSFQEFAGNAELRKIRKLLEQQQQPGALGSYGRERSRLSSRPAHVERRLSAPCSAPVPTQR